MDALEKKFSRSGIEIMGGGEMLDGSGSDITVLVTNIEKDIKALRKFLAKKRVPKASKIVRETDEVREEIPAYNKGERRKSFSVKRLPRRDDNQAYSETPP